MAPRSRAFVEGGGSSCPIAAPAGLPSIPVIDASNWYDLVSGGLLKFRQNRVTYEGAHVGGDGALVGESATPTNAPTIAPHFGTGLSAGVYGYAQTFYDGSGQTLPSPTATVTAGASVTSPPDGPNIERLSGGNLGNFSYYWALTFVDVNGGETLPGPISHIAVMDPPYGSAHLTFIWTSSDPNVVARKIYRNYGGIDALKLVATIADNTTTTYTDNVADASLGATAPTVSTAIYNQMSLTSIGRGPSGTTGRKLYRTAAGGTQLKLLATIADNTTTTYTDSIADGSLGADVPVTNTSSLTAPGGLVLTGATSMPVTAIGPFVTVPSYGWVSVGGQFISYTGISGLTLTGIPASGTGSIASTLNYGTEILSQPFIFGIPSSGVGSIQYDVPTGEPVNILVQVDDVAAQAILAALEGGDGIHEFSIQDNRLALSTATARATAELERFKSPIVTVTYETHDPKTRAGKTITFDLGEPTNLQGDFVIQRVTRSEFTGLPFSYPRCSVEASNVKFSLEDLLRRALLEQSA